MKYLRGWFQDRTAADRAAFSRALRRLEQRGLVVRTNYSRGLPDGSGWARQRADQPAPVRSDHVILTDQGRAVAEAVNKQADELC
jgi:DNA-binding MarR family transcriptional regulator